MLATLLAVIGLYGVMAYTVARRTREIGVRMALGAVQGDVVWLVMREVLVLVGSGIVLGLAAAWGLGRLISSQLYGVTANDPVDDCRRRGPARSSSRCSPATCPPAARRASIRCWRCDTNNRIRPERRPRGFSSPNVNLIHPG